MSKYDIALILGILTIILNLIVIVRNAIEKWRFKDYGNNSVNSRPVSVEDSSLAVTTITVIDDEY